MVANTISEPLSYSDRLPGTQPRCAYLHRTSMSETFRPYFVSCTPSAEPLEPLFGLQSSDIDNNGGRLQGLDLCAL